MYDNTAAAYRFVIDTSGNVGINTTSALGNLHVQLPGGASGWDRFIVKTTSWWGDGTATRSETAGTQYATMYQMMFSTPHIVSNSDGWCPLRMGRAGGVSTGRWWEVAVRADGNFQIGVERSAQLVINQNGNVSIGTYPASGTIIFNNPSTPLLLRNLSNGNISAGALSTYTYNNNSVGWGGGLTVTSAFFLPNTTCTILFVASASLYSSVVAGRTVTYTFTLGGINTSRTSFKFFNTPNNHEQVFYTTALSASVIGGAGSYNITASTNGITDFNDTIHWSVMVIG
jgi:hypothetical protein